MLDINTPEIFHGYKDQLEKQIAIVAKKFVEDWFTRYGGKCIVQVYKLGGFRRWLARVYSPDKKENLNDLPIQLGLAGYYTKKV